MDVGGFLNGNQSNTTGNSQQQVISQPVKPRPVENFPEQEQ
jgi:hypothetical protein